ncbi:hypothetical protein BDQ17DRAFT_1344704 [Cyathus striatus]|nr:hypothetical protein BDQ17DRAFT_1344704 [Cyathus striatus]
MRLTLIYFFLSSLLVLIMATASPEPEPIVILDSASLPPVEDAEIKPAAWSRHSKKLVRIASPLSFMASIARKEPSDSEDASKSETQPRRRLNRPRRRPHP